MSISVPSQKSEIDEGKSPIKRSISLPKHFKLINKTYEKNVSSNFTEQIEKLGRTFEYSENSEMYWGDQEFSILYGTPIYEQVSASQKRALNHLYWVGQYNHTANAEANTMLYNQVTTGVFAHISGYEKLCEELNFETNQERFHINTFQRIGMKTKLAIMGRASLGRSIRSSTHLKKNTKFIKDTFGTRWGSTQSASLQDACLRFVNHFVYGSKNVFYSQYLAERKNHPVPTATGGLAGNTASPLIIKFLTLNWGSSPFMACHYYTMRMIANISLKGFEHQYFKRYQKLNRESEKIPVPTAVSYNHLLDEAFHTTMSQVIAQDVYRQMPHPKAFEKYLGNLIVLRGLKGVVGGLSGWLPMTFRDDAFFLTALYRLLRSPVFEFSHRDTLYWMERCLCEEHEGFHSNVQHHQNLLEVFQRFFDPIDYLWPMARKVRPMVVGGSLERALKRNQQAFKRFFVPEEQR